MIGISGELAHSDFCPVWIPVLFLKINLFLRQSRNLYVALAGLELTVYTTMAFNSEICLQLPSKFWDQTGMPPYLALTYFCYFNIVSFYFYLFYECFPAYMCMISMPGARIAQTAASDHLELELQTVLTPLCR